MDSGFVLLESHGHIAQLDQRKAFSEPIVTKVVPLSGFYPGEAYHQNYLAPHPDQPYIVINDLPKLEQLQTSSSALNGNSQLYA